MLMLAGMEEAKRSALPPGTGVAEEEPMTAIVETKREERRLRLLNSIFTSIV
jgi:hypothetical protein